MRRSSQRARRCATSCRRCQRGTRSPPTRCTSGRETTQALCDGGSDCVPEIKGNQPTIDRQLRTEYQWSGRRHRTVAGGQGRIETHGPRIGSEIDRDVPELWLGFAE